MSTITCQICGGMTEVAEGAKNATCRFCGSPLTPTTAQAIPKAPTLTAYEGGEPYIFISYAHKDTDRVMPILKALAAKGFRIWYDAGIEAGTEWPDYIAEHLEKASCFLSFLSENSLASKNCRQEINYAMDLDRPMMIVHLEELTLTGGLRMRLGLVQAIFYHRHPSLDSFVEELAKARELQSCRGSVPTPTSIPVPTPAPTPTPTPTPTPNVRPTSPLTDFDIRGSVIVKYKGRSATVTIPGGVTEIAKYAFANQNITSVHIPDSVTAIGFRAFSGCHRLMQVRLPARLSKLEDSVFENCSSLARIALPQSLKTIGSYAFSGCTALAELRNTAQLAMIDRLAFYHCHALREVALTPGTRLGQDAFPTTTKLVKATKQ